MTALQRGTVTALDGVAGPGLYVKVPKLNDGHAFGPCALTEAAARIGLATGAASAGAAHTHPLAAAWAVGNRVLVGFVADDINAPIVIDRIG